MTSTTLRRVTSMTYGDALASDERIDGAVPVLSSGGVTGTHDRPNTKGPVIVVGRKGSHGTVWWSAEAAFVIDTAYFIDASNTAADLRYLYYLLQSLNLSALSADVGVPGLSREAAYEARVPDTPIDEQRRIADFLDDRVARIDQIIDTRRAQPTTAEDRYDGVRRNAVLGLSGAKVATDLPWAPHVGTSWGVRRLKQLARMGTGHTPSRSEPDYWVDCQIPWLTTSDVHKFRYDQIDRIDATEVEISALGLANSAAVMHPANTVALSRTASAGFSVVMDRSMATSQDFVTWTCGDALSPDFLLHTIRVMRPYLLGYLSMGSTHKTIYFPDLMDLRVPLPPLDRQEMAVAQIREASRERSTLLGALDQQILLLQEYKQSLITAAVTGELDVTTAGSGLPG